MVSHMKNKILQSEASQQEKLRKQKDKKDS